VVTCTVGSLAVGAAWTITISVAVPDDASPGTVTNGATVAAVGDTDPSNDSASQTTTIEFVAGESDLAVTKTVDDANPEEGQIVAYTVTVSNGGPDDATGVQVTDLLPSGLAFVSADASQGAYDPGSGVWTVGDVAVGGSATLSIRARVEQGTAGTSITNGAAVSAVEQADPTPDDGSDTAPVVIAGTGGSGGGGGGSGGGTGGTSGGSTAVTGFGAGPATFRWLAFLVTIGMLAVAFAEAGRRRPLAVVVGEIGPGVAPVVGGDAAATTGPRYLAEPFVFSAEDAPPPPEPAPRRYLAEPFVFVAE
jgi:uncharacterized repeat protein (TIGR01451 family)